MTHSLSLVSNGLFYTVELQSSPAVYQLQYVRPKLWTTHFQPLTDQQSGSLKQSILA